MATNEKKDTKAASKTPNPYENVLRSAWARLLMYDDASSSQKQRYQLTRRWAILLWFSASFIAIIKAVFDFEVIAGVQRGRILEGFLQLLLVMIPAAGVAVMSWGIQFANSVAWIEYRTSAEKIRSQIYLFRTSSSDYYNLTPEQQHDRLLSAVNEADRLIPEGIGLPSNLLLPQDPKVAGTLNKKADDEASAIARADGFFTQMTVDEYIEMRVKNQIGWYTGRVSKDMKSMERYQMVALGVAGLGTVLAALGYGIEAFVALTTAAGIAVAMWSNIRMFGATYFIFRQTANDLQDELDRWNALDPIKRTPEGARSFIETAEKIFLRENEEWRKQSIQMQTANEQTLLKNMQMSGVKLPPVPGSQEAVTAARKELNELPPTPPGEVTPDSIVDGAKGIEPIGEPILDPAPPPEREPIAESDADVSEGGAGTNGATDVKV
jgi:SMODS and SLOG-associating 2TM effector domain 1